MSAPSPQAPTSRQLYGRALADWHRGARDKVLITRTSLGEQEILPVSVFFRDADELYAFEDAALAACAGRVLDVGAGTGVHSLILQELGFEVTALEFLPELVEIERQRGVIDPRLADLWTFEGERYDTVLMMMNGVGPAGTLEGFARMLETTAKMLQPGGQILLDSAPAHLSDDLSPDFQPSWPIATPSYQGEAWIELQYDGERGSAFRELYLDYGKLTEIATACGYHSQPIYQEEDGTWAARLTRD